MSGRLRITLVRSIIGCTADQRRAVRTLGLHRIREAVVREDRDDLRGILRQVAHLVTVEEVAK